MENRRKVMGKGIAERVSKNIASAASCERCGGCLKSRKVPEFVHPALGLPGVVLKNAVEEVYCTSCGTVDSVHFPNMAGLSAAIAVARVKQNIRLSGTDIRFLRKALGLNQQELADLMGVRNETVSRWEAGRQPIEAPSEKLLRALTAIKLSDQTPAISVDFKELIEIKVTAASKKPQPVLLVLEPARVLKKVNHRQCRLEAWAAVPA
jgi:putative zinc finger/helix-turn-helix YgiT family protein